MPKASIIICSMNRPKSLERCIDSLKNQTCQDYEIILCQEEGNLVELKDKGWRQAKGEICIWLDDDVVCEPYWLENILKTFESLPSIVGITGPTYVPLKLVNNRDIFKYREGLIGRFYNWFFLEGKRHFPGIITNCGANTYGANFSTLISHRLHFVDFLEPSQFAVRKTIMEYVGGFDLEYKGVAEWCDVDLCYRIKEYGQLLYNHRVVVDHYPEQDSIYAKRLDTVSRYKNYMRFAKRWVKPSFKHYLYRGFLKTYFWAKGKGLI